MVLVQVTTMIMANYNSENLLNVLLQSVQLKGEDMGIVLYLVLHSTPWYYYDFVATDFMNKWDTPL